MMMFACRDTLGDKALACTAEPKRGPRLFLLLVVIKSATVVDFHGPTHISRKALFRTTFAVCMNKVLIQRAFATGRRESAPVSSRARTSRIKARKRGEQRLAALTKVEQELGISKVCFLGVRVSSRD